MTRNIRKDARAYAQDMASFAFNTAMRLGVEHDADDRSKWLDAMVDEFETQIADALRAAAEPEAKACKACGDTGWERTEHIQITPCQTCHKVGGR